MGLDETAGNSAAVSGAVAGGVGMDVVTILLVPRRGDVNGRDWPEQEKEQKQHS